MHHNIIRHRSYTTNGYAIGCHAPNMRVYANVVKSVGRGIHLTGNGIDFYNNIVEPREKPNPEYPETRTHGIKLEGPTHTQVHHNFCRVVAEEGFGEADPLDFDCGKYSANQVYKNTIVAVRKSPKYWAASVNVVRAHPECLTQVYDNVFRTNQYHVQIGWGGGSGITFRNNRFELLPDAGDDYRFFHLWMSSAARTHGMVFRDSVLGEGADYRKAKLLYDRAYTRGNIDMTVEWSVNVTAVDPAGKAVVGVSVKAVRDGKDLAQSVTGGDGKASVVLTDFDVIGNEGKPPFEEHGPYELVFTKDGAVVHRQNLDPRETTDFTVTVTDPKRKLYVYAGENQRHETNEAARLEGKVVVVGDDAAKPDVTWRVLRGGTWPIENPKAAATVAVMNKNGQSDLEIEAKWGDEVAKDKLTIRTDTKATPTAVAQCPQTAKVNTIVQLDATRSTDPRGFPRGECTYAWKQVAGPAADLASDELADPIFFPTEPGTYTFELVFSNPIRTSKPAQCSVVVTE